MAWKQVNADESNGDSFFKWTTAGQSLEGKWEGLSEGKFGDMGSINGTKFPMHTVLSKSLEKLEEGVNLKIVYLGKKTGKSGREYKNFDIFIEE